ncbi:copper oxidase [Roseibium aquae]|uniref:Copper oxidase n=1 Tax=Roseibium aquae TaxID=1323746 RepID=A0A916THW5_9HYPH|nr:multicopper oxidase family protein [Roseibium aquae]GGB46269.1 copper oxidase [Roseibium aquae]
MVSNSESGRLTPVNSRGQGQSRRRFLQAAGALAATGAVPGPSWALAQVDDGFLELTARPAPKRLYENTGLPSDLWTYNGTAPGPEIRVKHRERVRVRLINELPEATSIHWHGIRIDNAMDGVAGLTQDPVPPGEVFEYDFEVPDAGTFWYHAHTKSWNQVGRGLYGALIVEENTPPTGREQDLVLVVDDWRLTRDGRLDTESFGSLHDWSHGGRLGNWLTVNGRTNPDFRLQAGEIYRLRIINAANARILAIDPKRIGGDLIAYDGQPLAVPRPFDWEVELMGPGQRFDLILRPEAESDLALVELSGNQPLTFARFPVEQGGAIKAPDVRLPKPNPFAAPDLGAARVFELDMTGGAMGRMGQILHKGEVLDRDGMRRTGQVWAFNGHAGNLEAPLFQAHLGETVVIRTRNLTRWPHAMHAHGHHFRILQDGALGEWRDTFLIAPEEQVEIAFQAENPGKWLFHCHMLEHAAGGMTSWFEVLRA